jgi:hypothetical protein
MKIYQDIYFWRMVLFWDSSNGFLKSTNGFTN